MRERDPDLARAAECQRKGAGPKGTADKRSWLMLALAWLQLSEFRRKVECELEIAKSDAASLMRRKAAGR